MRRYLLVAWGAMVCMGGFGTAWADDPVAAPAETPPAAEAAPAGDAGQEDATFTGLDKNSDGQLDESEVTDEQRGLFDRLMRRGDTNQDGKLSREEFLAGLKRRRERDGEAGPGPGGAGPGGPGARLEGLFQRWDANTDGQVELDEVPEDRQPMFERMLDQFDDNDDDKLSLDEFRAGARRFAERFRGGAGGPPGGRPFGGAFGGGGGPPEGAGSPDGPPGGGPPPGGPGGGGGGPGRGGPLMAALDADHDGQVSATEISSAPEALKKLDKNGDGTIAREELGPPPGQAGIPPSPGPGQPGYRLMQGFHNADGDSDGKLSRQEMPPRLASHFDKLDVNSDGYVDEEEFRLALGYLAKRMQPGAGGKPGKGGKRPKGAPPSAL